jgi:hypothetical protein
MFFQAREFTYSIYTVRVESKRHVCRPDTTKSAERSCIRFRADFTLVLVSIALNPIILYIDADACPVKQEIYRVAERHALKGTTLKVLVVTNSPIAVPRDPMIERVVVGAGMDEADSVSVAIANKDNTTRRGPAVCRAAAEEDCRVSRTSRRSARRTHRYRHWCARGPCCSATAHG